MAESKIMENEAATIVQNCQPWSGFCFTSTCIMDFFQNYGYHVIFIDCGLEQYRFQDTGCIGPSVYDYCDSEIFENEN